MRNQAELRVTAIMLQCRCRRGGWEKLRLRFDEADEKCSSTDCLAVHSVSRSRARRRTDRNQTLRVDSETEGMTANVVVRSRLH